MQSDSLRSVYHNLRLLEQVDAVRSAHYRQQAQEVLADSRISLRWRQAISNRLQQANHLLEMQTVETDDSY
jgi:hypothetical protein